MNLKNKILALILVCVSLYGCKTTSSIPAEKKQLYQVQVPLSEIIDKIPNYSGSLIAAKGKGRAIVSEKGNSDRVTIDFDTDTALSLLSFKNRIGIRGGSMLVDADSILIYNRIDKYAQKISVNNGRMTSLNELASVNLLDLMNFKIKAEDVKNILQSDSEYVLGFHNNGMARVNKKTGTVSSVQQPPTSGLPYSSINYESYGTINGYKLPRKITILSADRESKVVFQIRSLEVNPDKLNLTLKIPEDIPIERS